jgi:hypothetical protein
MTAPGHEHACEGVLGMAALFRTSDGDTDGQIGGSVPEAAMAWEELRDSGRHWIGGGAASLVHLVRVCTN